MTDDIQEQRPSWAPIELTPFLDGTYQPPPRTMLPRTDGECLLYPGLVQAFYGEPESGKSLIVQYETARLARLGRKVLYLDFESDPGSVMDRMKAFGASIPQLQENLAYVSPTIDPTTQVGRSPLLASTGNRAAEQDAFHQLLAQQWDLVVIDGVTSALVLFGMRSKENDEVTAWYKLLPERFATETGAAVVLIDHVTKDRESAGRFAIGAQAKLAALSGPSFVVEPKGAMGKGQHFNIELHLTKDRAGSLRHVCGPYRQSTRMQLAAVVEFDARNPGQTMVTVFPPKLGPDEHAEFRPTAIMEQLSRALEESPAERSSNEWLGQVKGKRETLGLAANLLVEEGFVRVQPGPRNSKLHTSVRPYRQRQDPKSDRYAGSPLPDEGSK